MNSFITPVAAALLLSSAVEPVLAESYSLGVARIQLPKISTSLDLANRAVKAKDYETACSEMGNVVRLTRWNLAGLEELSPHEDWVETLQRYRALKETFCKASRY